VTLSRSRLIWQSSQHPGSGTLASDVTTPTGCAHGQGAAGPPNVPLLEYTPPAPIESPPKNQLKNASSCVSYRTAWRGVMNRHWYSSGLMRMLRRSMEIVLRTFRPEDKPSLGLGTCR
jgi:hypothetical protein